MDVTTSGDDITTTITTNTLLSNSITNPSLQRFIDAQETIYETVLSELTLGKKRTHWIWFIFPQIIGLPSKSVTSLFYSIKSKEEAIDYLNDSVLGSRLRQCTRLVIQVQDKSISDIFGLGGDDIKFKSSMTLFNVVCKEEESIFKQALDKYFNGKEDLLTLEILEKGLKE
jgi:uncharacterized protein (DUF1810 family)